MGGPILRERLSPQFLQLGEIKLRGAVFGAQLQGLTETGLGEFQVARGVIVQRYGEGLPPRAGRFRLRGPAALELSAKTTRRHRQQHLRHPQEGGFRQRHVQWLRVQPLCLE